MVLRNTVLAGKRVHDDIQIVQVHQNGPHVPVKADATQECVLQDFPPENYCINVKDAQYLHLKKKHDRLQHSAVKQRDAGFWKQLSRVWNCLKVLPAPFLSFSIFFQPDESKRKAKEETQEVHQKVVEAVDGLTAALKEGGRNVKTVLHRIEHRIEANRIESNCFDVESNFLWKKHRTYLTPLF